MVLRNLKKEKDFFKGFSLSPHPLTNFEIQKCYQNEHRFNGVYSRDNLLDRVKDRGICNIS